MITSSPIKLTSARSRFFTAARFTKQRLDSSRQKEDDAPDLAFVLSISASVEKRVALDVPKSVSDKEAPHWPNVPEYYELKGIVGVGSYGLHYSAFCKTRGEPCAIKIFDLKKWSQSGLDNLLKEVVSMSSLAHDNITTYYSTFVGKEELWLVTKNMENGSLLDVIRRKQRAESCKHGVFDENTIATIMTGIVNGLMFLHELGYIHKDIKAENILIGGDGSVKISDFCVVNCISKMRSYVGSPRWLAPEIIEDINHKYTPKADVWSLGITSIETATGSPPYHKSSTMKVLLLISLNKPPTLETVAETTDQYDKYGRAFRNFIANCLRKDPSERPPVKELLFHPFFKKSRDQEYLRNVFASIPYSQEPTRRHLPKKDQTEASYPKEKKEWVLTSAELLVDSEPHDGPADSTRVSERNYDKNITRQSTMSPPYSLKSRSSYTTQDDKSIRSFKSYGSKGQKSTLAQTHHIILKTRGLHLDTPMVLKTGIQNKRELFDIAFSYDTNKDKPESVVEDLVREGLINPKDRHPVMMNLKKLLGTSPKADEEPVSITFRLHSDIENDEALCESNLIGYATLILKSTEVNVAVSPSSADVQFT